MSSLFLLVVDDVLPAERSRPRGNEEYLQCAALDDEDLLRSDRSSTDRQPSLPGHFHLRLGITGTLRRPSDGIHDAFSHSAHLRSRQTAFHSNSSF